jgi:hypothetical protein
VKRARRGAASSISVLGKLRIGLYKGGMEGEERKGRSARKEEDIKHLRKKYRISGRLV